MKFHCPLCGEELEVALRIEKVDTEGMASFGRSQLYVSFMSQAVDHMCKKGE